MDWLRIDSALGIAEGGDVMSAVYMFLSFVSGGAAMANFSEIRRDPKTTGWVFGVGLLLCFVFAFLAIWKAP